MMQHKTLFYRLITMLFPNICSLCGEKCFNEEKLCLTCKHNLSLNNSRCQQCALPIAKNNSICGKCLNNKPYYDKTFAPYLYQSLISRLILDLKFNQQLANAVILGELLFLQIKKQNIICPDVLIPVPLHKKRLKQRGFNQALEIAKILSKKLNTPIDYQACQRIKNTLPQSEISAEERKKNIHQAFAISKKINYQHIAIIDDVMTTGNTVNELAKALKKSGIKKISVWCIARA